MTFAKFAQLLAPSLILALFLVSEAVKLVRLRRGRKLFMDETGRTKAQWDNLPDSQQAEWVRRDADDREINRFIKDFNHQKKK